MRGFKSIIVPFILGCFLNHTLNGQEIPLKPISYRVFTPFIFNPAIAGSHDYGNLDINVAFQGESNAQLLSFNSRLVKTETGYFNSPDIVSFRSTAVGGYLFRDMTSTYQNSGAGAVFSWHIPLNRKKFSYLSFGTALKGYFTSPGESGGEEPPGTSVKGLHPDMDLGLYYYGTNFYAGFSANNLVGRTQDEVNPGEFRIPVSRQYFLLAGYKFLLVKSQGIIFEPSLISNFDSLAIKNAGDNIRPVFKLYLQNFCLGTYFHDKDKNAFFFQYRYPGFHIGGYFALPKESPYYPKDVIVEINAGILLYKDKNRKPD